MINVYLYDYNTEEIIEEFKIKKMEELRKYSNYPWIKVFEDEFTIEYNFDDLPSLGFNIKKVRIK